MDRKISPEKLRQRRNKLLLRITLLSGGVILLFWIMVIFFRTDLNNKDIVTAVVDRGMLDISVAATGQVVPLYEEIITSPVSSKILEIYKKSGDKLQKGDSILKLDLATVNANFEQQSNELKMKFSKLEQQKASAKSILADLQMQLDIDSMKLERTEVLLRNEKYLDSLGATTKDRVKQVELEYQVQCMQYKQLKLKYENQKRSFDADIKVSELDYTTAKRNFSITVKTLGEAQVRSPRQATLKWVNDEVGSSVSQGAKIAIISDLENFKVSGEISDSYADKVAVGNKAVVEIGKEKLTGSISNVVPAVDNGTINFTVILDDNRNRLLRSGLKVDIYIVNSLRDNVLRLAKRSYYVGNGEYYLWVVEDNTAIKRKVKLGESSYEHVEIIEGLLEGEKVIISDMSRYNDKDKMYIAD